MLFFEKLVRKSFKCHYLFILPYHRREKNGDDGNVLSLELSKNQVSGRKNQFFQIIVKGKNVIMYLMYQALEF